MEDSRSHYAARLRLAGEERSDTNDGVLLSSPKTIALFPSRPEVEQYASTQNITLEAGEPPLYDLDRLTEWLSSPTSTPDCKFLLNAWNILADIAATLQTSLNEPAAAQAICDKLFWGCNLPSMTPSGMTEVAEAHVRQLRSIQDTDRPVR